MKVVRYLVSLQHGQIVLGGDVDDLGLGAVAVVEVHADLARAPHHVQVGEDGAVVDDHDSRAQAPVEGAALGVFLAVVGLVHQALHAHERRCHRSRRAGVGGGQGILLERGAHGGVDVVLRDQARALGGGQRERQQRETRCHHPRGPGLHAPALRECAGARLAGTPAAAGPSRSGCRGSRGGRGGRAGGRRARLGGGGAGLAAARLLWRACPAGATRAADQRRSLHDRLNPITTVRAVHDAKPCG